MISFSPYHFFLFQSFKFFLQVVASLCTYFWFANTAAGPQVHTKIIAKDGDLTLILMSSEDETYKFIVSRRVLSEASLVWNAMLNGRFLESSQDTITLHEDDPEALDTVLCIIHLLDEADLLKNAFAFGLDDVLFRSLIVGSIVAGKFQKLLPMERTVQQLLQLACLCDKYNTTALVKPFIEFWVEPWHSQLTPKAWKYKGLEYPIQDYDVQLKRTRPSTRKTGSRFGSDNVRDPGERIVDLICLGWQIGIAERVFQEWVHYAAMRLEVVNGTAWILGRKLTFAVGEEGNKLEDNEATIMPPFLLDNMLFVRECGIRKIFAPFRHYHKKAAYLNCYERYMRNAPSSHTHRSAAEAYECNKRTMDNLNSLTPDPSFFLTEQDDDLSQFKPLPSDVPKAIYTGSLHAITTKFESAREVILANLEDARCPSCSVQLQLHKALDRYHEIKYPMIEAPVCTLQEACLESNYSELIERQLIKTYPNLTEFLLPIDERHTSWLRYHFIYQRLRHHKPHAANHERKCICLICIPPPIRTRRSRHSPRWPIHWSLRSKYHLREIKAKAHREDKPLSKLDIPSIWSLPRIYTSYDSCDSDTDDYIYPPCTGNRFRGGTDFIQAEKIDEDIHWDQIENIQHGFLELRAVDDYDRSGGYAKEVAGLVQKLEWSYNEHGRKEPLHSWTDEEKRQKLFVQLMRKYGLIKRRWFFAPYGR
ncbi:hypothetical protein EJ08DRAFT_644666 [Tothia fuscella]|uniref:BTB domain-containing protein n=1 Tax=Tothia fuscella TaxID=1048955 RepID=A0A9P4P5J2_9PEZI|nr:hypothetical protein EJ08DRAFT_644666 [Tothia fuscella]